MMLTCFVALTLLPLKFHEALCLEKLNKKPEADEIFTYIAGIEIEYFSNMHLKELPYYQAYSLKHLGEELKARHLITKYMREWDKIQYIKDNGYFSTTPFFISFADEPSKMRAAQHTYLLALCNDYIGNSEKAKVYIEESAARNCENLFALYFKKFGFLY